MQVIVENLGHFFNRDRWLFRNLNYEFRSGAIHAIIGPSGSGKSTLLGVLAGWASPREGRVISEGVKQVSWVFQNPLGVPGRNIRDQVALPLLGQGFGTRDALAMADRMLDEFGLGDSAERRFKELSGGEAQRFMLARGVASRPQLLLVDEPTAQLDLQTAAEVGQFLAKTASEATVVLVATHDDHIQNVCADVLDLRSFRGEPIG